MEIDLQEILSQDNLLLAFVVIGSGYLLSRIRIGPVPVGSTTGVLLAGLLFGHLGFPDTPGAAQLGFTLFIFSVGLQAGPRFFNVFFEDGPRYFALAAVVAATAISSTLLLARLLELGYGFDAGLLAGSLTSTPTLAGAQDALRSGLATPPEGVSAAEALADISVAYAITYIFGTAGLILFVHFFPRAMGIDLASESRRYAREHGLEGARRQRAPRLPVVRAFQVLENAHGRALREVEANAGPEVQVLRLRRGHQILEPSGDLVIEPGDVVSVLAPHDVIAEHQERLGHEVLDPQLINYEVVTREIVVTSDEATKNPLADLNITAEYGCVPAGIVRSAIELGVDESTVLNKGDILRVTGERERIQTLAERIGYIDADTEETDLMTFSFGLVGGILLGMVLLKIGSVSLGLGSAGGLLLVGILIGYLRSIHPTFGGVPAPARFVLMELGLMLFMAQVGLKAGGGIVEAFASVGPALVASGVLVTLVSVSVAYVFGRFVLKLNPALLMGAMTGAMTSTPSLGVVQAAARSSVPALGYAGTYTFANVLLTFAGTFLMMR